MFLTICLYIALIIFGLGLLYKVTNWFRYTIGIEHREITPKERIYAAFKGIVSTISSPKIMTLLRVFLLDVVFQRRVFKESALRWFMHMSIFGGFISLLLMHGLDTLITSALFADYSPTLNPFLFLKNLFGILVIVGLSIAVYRRFIQRVPRLMTNAMDKYIMILLTVIMVSGFFLEASKIVSFTSFTSMVDDYADVDDEQALRYLESYWVEKFGIVSPSLKGTFDETTLAKGKEIHEISCAACHSRPQWAPVSYGASKLIKPVALELDWIHFATFMRYIHILSCFIGLAYLPFSKMFHIFASPVSLLVNAAMDGEGANPANIATRQVMELDACTHCGACTLQCAVGICFEEIPNVNILPSEKIASIKRLAAGKELQAYEIRSIQEGLFLCTNCYRCTIACPVGINLQELWFNVREALLQKGHAEFLALSPLSLYRGLKSEDITEEQYRKPLQLAREAMNADGKRAHMPDSPIDHTHIHERFRRTLGSSFQGNSFSYCFTCTTCSTACPVVHSFKNPRDELGLLPHQIIHAAALGLSDLIFSSNMLWDCLGCYECQEHCPQGVQVADVLFELKNLAIKHVKGKIQNSKKENDS